MSSCLLCHYRIPLLDAPLGGVRDPVGLCPRCASLSCGWHGARTRSAGFICIICDTGGLLASAGWGDFKRHGGLDRLPPDGGEVSVRDGSADLARALAASFSTADRYPDSAVVATLRQWFDERPHYAGLRKALDAATAWAVKVLNGLLQPPAGGGTGRRVNGHYDDHAIASLWSRLDADGRQFLAAAVLLILALDLPLETLPLPVVDVAQMLGMPLRDFPGQIAELRGQITRSQ